MTGRLGRGMYQLGGGVFQSGAGVGDVLVDNCTLGVVPRQRLLYSYPFQLGHQTTC